MRERKSLKVTLTEMVYRIAKFIVKPIVMRKYKPKIINNELIPKEGPIIFASNHRHKMDQYFVIASTKRCTHWGAKEEYFNGVDSVFGDPNPLTCKLTTILLKSVGSIEIDRKGDTGKAKQEFEKYLNMGTCIGLFPEGTRNKTKDVLLPFKFGAVSTAKKTDSWIQPVSITGEMKKDTKDLIVNFRKPFKVGDMSLEEANELLRKEILDGINENKKFKKKQN